MPDPGVPRDVPSEYSRRAALRVGGAALGTGLVGLAGCTGFPSDYPDVSDEAARERALDAEETYLRERLRNVSCLEDWGTTPTTASREATVTDRTGDGVHVQVTHPYWYSTDQTEADGASEALYVVTDGSAERVRGESLSVSC